MRWVAILVLLGACGEADHEEHDEQHWGYEGDSGPEYWYDLGWKLSKTGQRQSPIDLAPAEKGDAGKLELHYTKSRLHVSNNGHTLLVVVDEGSWMSLDGERYDLKQFHYHSPSEHTIGGVHWPVEVHLVHKNQEGNFVVVALLAEAGEPGVSFGKIMAHTPPVGGKRTVPDYVVDIGKLVPTDLHHYRYDGSLTTPPLTENVTWIVMKIHNTLSKEQIADFRRLYPNNSRPIQPLHGRKVTVD